MAKRLGTTAWMDKMFPNEYATDNYSKGNKWLKDHRFEVATVDKFTTDGKGETDAERLYVYQCHKATYRGNGKQATLVWWCNYNHKSKKWHVSLVATVEDETTGGDRTDSSCDAVCVENAIAKLRKAADAAIEKVGGENAVRVENSND